MEKRRSVDGKMKEEKRAKKLKGKKLCRGVR